MKEDKLRYIQRMARRLSPHEVETLRRFLTAFETRGESHIPKTLTLLNLLLSHDDVNEIMPRLKKALDASSDDAVRMIAHRLKEKIGESLILDINANRGDGYDDIIKAEIEVTKKKQVAAIYRTRGLESEVEHLYARIITLGKKYELYNDLIEVLLAKQGLLGMKHGPKKFFEMEQEIEYYECCRTAATNAKKAYYRTIRSYAFKGLNRNDPSEDYLTSLDSEITVLKKDFEETSSAIVGFYYYLLQIEFFQIRKRYDKASEYCLHLVDIVRNNASVYMKRRLGIAYLNLSQNEIFNYYFDYSIGFAKEAQKCFNPHATNHNLAIELEFYANYYAGRMDEAEQSISRLVEDTESEQSEFRRSWRQYLMACVQFVRQDYRAVNLALNETKKINKDKIGWNLGVRVLSIVTAIEQENHDFADSQILSMQQFMRQSLKGTPLRARDEAVLKILLALRRESYNFVEVGEKNQETLEQLSRDEDADYSWEVQSPELIVFHKWFESKSHDTVYEPLYTREYVHSLEVAES